MKYLFIPFYANSLNGREDLRDRPYFQGVIKVLLIRFRQITPGLRIAMDVAVGGVKQ